MYGWMNVRPSVRPSVGHGSLTGGEAEVKHLDDVLHDRVEEALLPCQHLVPHAAQRRHVHQLGAVCVCVCVCVYVCVCVCVCV